MASPTEPIARHFVAPQSYTLARLKRFVAATAFTLTLLVAVRLWFVEGLLRRVTIDGPSMAPALCGASYRVLCADCGFGFRCDAEHVPADGLAACPNCGFGENRLDAARHLPPDGVVIDRWPLIWRRPRRGDVVAFRTVGGELAVKRIAGLPGERLAIQGGDLYADQQLMRKTRAEFDTMRLLVHDNGYRPRITPRLPPRWRPAKDDSRWKAIDGGFQIEPTVAEPGGFDWLEYEHWPCTADAHLRGTAAPITDNDSYNQGETRRPLNVVSDMVLSCQLSATGTGQVAFAATDGEQRFEAQVEPGKRVRLVLGSQTLVDLPLGLHLSRRAAEIEFGLCDRQVLLSASGRTLIRYEYERRDHSQDEPLRPLAIGVRGIGLNIHQLRVGRDVFYLDPRGLPRRWQADGPLAANTFALLGDNQPVSIDSRHWEAPGISRANILGRVYPFWARLK
jgi:signal peptidase S26 family